tara:strand:- start:550 stop:885 length:336 start_codon:yes stop_codon:yes gene_type:complete
MPLKEWHGKELEQRVTGAAREAIDDTMARCVDAAKRRVPVKTTTLQGSIQMRPARVEGRKVVGLWGSFTVRYAIYVEMGTGRMSARPYLRPAADHHYPLLRERINKLLRGR